MIRELSAEMRAPALGRESGSRGRAPVPSRGWWSIAAGDLNAGEDLDIARRGLD